MRKYAQIILGVVVVLVAIALVIEQRSDLSDIRSDPEDLGTESNRSQERNWLPRTEFVQFGNDLQLARPRALKQFQGDLFVADGYYVRVDKIDVTGERISSYGNGVGEGPGELRRVIDYDVNADGLWLLDDISRRVAHFDGDGSFVSQVQLLRAVTRIAVLDTTMILMDLVRAEPFRWFTLNGVLVDSMGVFADRVVANPLALSGQILKDGSGSVAYLPLYAGYLFDLTKPIPRLIELIDDIPFPGADSRNKNGQQMLFAPDQPVKMRSVSFDNGVAWVLVLSSKDGESVGATLDGYGYPRGRYIGSLEMPVGVNSAVVLDSTVFAVKDTTLIKARILR